MLTKVVPESCQRTEGIFAWLENQEEKEKKRVAKEERKREKEEYLKTMTKERNKRNELRQKEKKTMHNSKMEKKDNKNNNFDSENKNLPRDQTETIRTQNKLNPPVPTCTACKMNKANCICDKRSNEVSHCYHNHENQFVF